MPKRLIVKVQRPLGGARDTPWLVYDESRAIYQFTAVNELPASVIKAMGKQAKRYFYARYDDATGGLIFGSTAAAQSW